MSRFVILHPRNGRRAGELSNNAPAGELLSHESNLVLVTDDYAASVEQIVRQAAAELAKR